MHAGIAHAVVIPLHRKSAGCIGSAQQGGQRCRRGPDRQCWQLGAFPCGPNVASHEKRQEGKCPRQGPFVTNSRHGPCDQCQCQREDQRGTYRHHEGQQQPPPQQAHEIPEQPVGNVQAELPCMTKQQGIEALHQPLMHQINRNYAAQQAPRATAIEHGHRHHAGNEGKCRHVKQVDKPYSQVSPTRPQLLERVAHHYQDQQHEPARIQRAGTRGASRHGGTPIQAYPSHGIPSSTVVISTLSLAIVATLFHTWNNWRLLKAFHHTESGSTGLAGNIRQRAPQGPFIRQQNRSFSRSAWPRPCTGAAPRAR